MSLTLICGPSGVGKTTIINEMVRDHQFRILPNFTTRPLRLGEIEREYLSIETVNELEQSGKTAFVNEIFSNKYGVLRKTLDDAFFDSASYVFDIGPQFLNKVSDRFNCVIFVMPESTEQLRRQLEQAKRIDRIVGSREEYDALKNDWNSWKSDPRAHCVMNLPGRICQTLADILAILKLAAR